MSVTEDQIVRLQKEEIELEQRRNEMGCAVALPIIMGLGTCIIFSIINKPGANPTPEVYLTIGGLVASGIATAVLGARAIYLDLSLNRIKGILNLDKN